MDILKGHTQKIQPSTAVTIGTFDGLHLGHQEIIKQTIRAAKLNAKPSVLITFDRRPSSLLAPWENAGDLITTDTKIKLIDGFGLDYLLLLEFSPALANLTPKDFCDQILVDMVNADQVFVGANFRFGAKAAGDVGFLKEYGQNHGFSLTKVPLLKINRQIISSTKLRTMIAAGEVEEVPAFLGRYHFVTGKVVKGAGRGAGIGFPTANLMIDNNLCMPKEGVYAGYVWLDNEPKEAVINVGANPTFGPGAVHMEAHIFNFSTAIYGEKVRLELQKYLRHEQKFPAVEALVKQISADAIQAKKWLAGAKPTGRLDH